MFKFSFVEFTTPQTFKSASSKVCKLSNSDNSPKRRGRPPKKKQEETPQVAKTEPVKESNTTHNVNISDCTSRKRKLESSVEGNHNSYQIPIVVSPPIIIEKCQPIIRNRKIIRTSISIKEILN